jgi:serine/threonine protein kinase
LIVANADRIIDLLHEAKARPAGAERERFLAEACRDDAALNEQIVSLLEADADDRGSFLKLTQILRPTILPTEKPGDRIGRYKLLEQIGEGGCGIVYMAEQEEPVRRRVALKVIKLGMDTKQVITRFEAERQALALMDHPNIARVLDAGATDTGRPFFVMELVRGIKITDYCDENNLSTNERLELFIQVCQAIQHAHQKGIIHRDIKPSNILVTNHDDVAVPKVIDFGIAKSISGQLTDKTVFTAFAQFIGTPAYMSPEQAQMSGLDIDTRADIYSLGVLLYELLTGNTPFDAKELLAAGMDEMRRKIREDEPAKPSTRLSTMEAMDLTSVAKRRHVEPPKLIHLIRGDLDWLVMKCLEKDRTRRYETANGLAVDIQRHLRNEPVVARPPSNLYRFQKLVRRHQLAFAAGAAVLVVLLVGIAASTWQAVRAKQAEAAAYANANQAKLNAERAERNAQQARDEANAKAVALAAEQRAREDETKARQQAFAVLRSMTADVVVRKFPPGTVLTEDDRAFLQGIIVQSVMLAKARYYISLSQWDKAFAEYAQADWSRPLEDDAFSYACLFLIRGDNEGYNRFCEGLIQQAGKMEGPEAYVLARVCTMASNSPVTPARVLQWANQVVAGSQNPWDFHVLGLAQYRAGQFDQALQSFTKANVKSWRYADLTWFGLALVHQRLGHPDQARQCLDKGTQWLVRVGPSGSDEPAKLLPQDWVEAQLLRREAEDLLTKQRSP